MLGNISYMSGVPVGVHLNWVTLIYVGQQGLYMLGIYVGYICWVHMLGDIYVG